MKMLMTTAAALLTIATAVNAQVDMGDVILEVQNGQIVTGSGYNSGVFQPARVFASEFGALFPDSTDEPGFDSNPSTFPPSSSNGFRIMDVLRRWNGQDFTTQAQPELEVAYFGQSVQTPTSPGVVDGIVLPVGSNGQWHRHFDFTLLSPAGNGVYLLQLSLFNTGNAILDSDPFWILFGQNADVSVLTAAYTWARDNLPGALPCSDIDFNNDSLFPDTQDIADLIAVFAGASCPTTSCDSVDFNADGLFPDTEDIADFLTVFAGGTC